MTRHRRPSWQGWQTVTVMAALTIPMVSGCSLFFVKGPTGPEPADCTDTYGWPALDMGLTLLEGVRTGLAMSASDASYANSRLTRSQDAALGVSLASWAAISATIGFVRAHDCREAIESARGPDPAKAEAAIRRYRRLQKERELREQQATAPTNSPVGAPAAAPGARPPPPTAPSSTAPEAGVPAQVEPAARPNPAVKQSIDDE